MKVYKEHGKVQDLENKIGNQNIEGTKVYSMNIANFEPKKLDYIKII